MFQEHRKRIFFNSAVYFRLPWSQRFFLIFLRERDQEEADHEWWRLLYWARPFKEVQDTILWRFLLKMLPLHQLLEVPIVKKLETRFPSKVHGMQLQLF